MFAAVAAVAARRTYLIESERDRVNEEARRKRDDEARKAQATLVSAWWGRHPRRGWGVYLRNASETPVYQAYMTILGPDGTTDGNKVHYAVVPPAAEAEFSEVPVEGRVQDNPTKRAKVGFTDAAGARWLRDEYGRLVELQPRLRVQTSPGRAAALSRFNEDFKAAYGVEVTFRTGDWHPNLASERFVTENRGSDDVVDALICPHDLIGNLVRQGVIEPTALAADQRQAFPAWALDALTYEGDLYGVPSTVDTVALIRNVALAPDAPATFEDMVAAGRELCAAGRARVPFAARVGPKGNPFHVWPLFTSAGGALFGRDAAGHWDPSRVRLDAPESVAAFDRLRSLGTAGEGLLTPSMGDDEAFELFTSGQAPFLLCSSDGLRHARRAGLAVAVDPVPPFADGGPATGFTSVHALVMIKNGPNREIAHDLFAEYLSQNRVMAALSAEISSPVALTATVSDDPEIRRFQRLCAAAPPMPSVPQMAGVWTALGTAEIAALTGTPADEVARTAQRTVTDLLAERP
ncbi:sugar ABC transporter substrate-binding protein [Actinomadura atramentaria]|uniref:sugar ABC transporter substrate-binding protein n=1 Tax=Actinomadura atramentaria TaxID=1990 RepID=UPI00146AB56C|nr:extracellular solute-binding protein [Actinomadura atramentaria]